MGTTYALVGGAMPFGQTKADGRHWRGLGQLALAAALAVGFLSLLRAPALTLGTPARPAAPSVHGPGALSFRVGPSGALEVAAGSTDALRVVPAGFGRGAIRPLESTATAARGVAATYDQGALSVWYSHRGDALDQGFTVTRRLPGEADKVVIAMATSGALRPELESPSSLTFEGSKVPAITYSSLKVTDATGRVLPARLGVSGTSVRIMFNDRHAVYPVRVDPWIQQSLLTPPAGSQAFGSALATSSNGTTVLVGDPYANLATVYTFSGGSWSSGVALDAASGGRRVRHVGGPVVERGGRPGRRSVRWRGDWGGDRLHLDRRGVVLGREADSAGGSRRVRDVGGALRDRNDRSGGGPRGRGQRHRRGDRVQL